MNLVKAIPEDLSQVVELTRRAYAHYVPIMGTEPVPMREDYAPRIAAGEVWLVKEGDSTAGLIVLEDGPEALLIFSVAIAPEHQGAGLGQRLLAFAEDLARERGFGTLALYTNALMERNIDIYRRFGFREVRRRPHPTLAGNVVVDMEKQVVPAASRRSA